MGDDARRYLFFVNIQLELDLHLCNGNDTKICKIKALKYANPELSCRKICVSPHLVSPSCKKCNFFLA